MKKVSLKDMKRENRRLVLQEVLEHDNLSRIELAQQSELSPSTVSSLVSELLEEAVLIETGELASTGGRKRTGLTINPDYASIAVVDVKRSGAILRMFDMDTNRMTNRLIHEKSPYLLQHAHNPVEWYPWGEEAFAKAKAENKPIFLSIGYSTCHWCHVRQKNLPLRQQQMARNLQSANRAEATGRAEVAGRMARKAVLHRRVREIAHKTAVYHSKAALQAECLHRRPRFWEQ